MRVLRRESDRERKSPNHQGMKKKSDPRHLRRIKLMQELFSWEFKRSRKPSTQIQEIISHLPKIDALIAKSAPDRPIDQINKVDLAILRLSVFEIILDKGIPPKVAVDEAIELGKQFGSDSSASFINGALGELIKIKKIKT